MTKISLIGAGSVVFTRNLCSDILLVPELQDCTISLMDIDAERLKMAQALVQAIVDQRGLKTKVEATLDRREAIKGADHVITTFQQGGLDAYKLDIEIPQKYGVEQCVGDTLGPGGIFRALRTIPIMIELGFEMDELAPDALLLNYVNPMSAICWAFFEATERPHVGLCHSVQGTSEMLAEFIEVPYDEVNYFCAGINHQAWFLQFMRGKDDLYPLIEDAVEKPEIYAKEPVRIDLMKHFGYFVTESSGHASEYMPYFRKNVQMIEEDLVPKFSDDVNSWFDYARSGGYLRHCIERFKEYRQEYEDLLAGTKHLRDQRSHEYGSYIIEAVETNKLAKINGNIPNHGLIDNLPEGCCVEVPCLVDGNGIQPVKVGNLPPQLAALNRTMVNVQSLIVEASLTGDTEAIKYAISLDPLTAAVCTLDQISAMSDELYAAQKHWLPQFD
ncbi:MAG: alpha-glucosidase/alpha-galactosidase [Anaerolineales bacterium]|jgi:alpha-galactosidase